MAVERATKREETRADTTDLDEVCGSVNQPTSTAALRTLRTAGDEAVGGSSMASSTPPVEARWKCSSLSPSHQRRPAAAALCPLRPWCSPPAPAPPPPPPAAATETVARPATCQNGRWCRSTTVLIVFPCFVSFRFFFLEPIFFFAFPDAATVPTTVFVGQKKIFLKKRDREREREREMRRHWHAPPSLHDNGDPVCPCAGGRRSRRTTFSSGAFPPTKRRPSSSSSAARRRWRWTPSECASQKKKKKKEEEDERR